MQDSRQPFVDSARRLIEIGHDPNSTIEMRHLGASQFALRAPLGVAAALAVEEAAHGPTFRRYRMASLSAVEAPGVAPHTRAATGHADTASGGSHATNP
jgi:hypothetical protein